MITIDLRGGLGNQLFQIFTILAYSYEHNKETVFLQKQISNGHRKKTYWDCFLSNLQPYLRCPKVVIFSKIFKESAFHYKKIPSHLDNTYFHGYFQSWKYFNCYKKEIFELITLEKQQQFVRDKLSTKWKDVDNCVSMHFRIGDYKQAQKFHSIMSIEYYSKALTELLSKTCKDDWVVMIVCEEEDIDEVYAKTDIIKKEFPNIRFERLDENFEDWEQMIAMSLCRHNIIANSTFSWFGAYFNSNIDKLVYYPSEWFGPAQKHLDTNDICPPDWIKV